MSKLRENLPRNEWIDGRLFIHEFGFYTLSNMRSWRTLFWKVWFVSQGDSSLELETMKLTPLVFMTRRRAQRFADKIHAGTSKMMTSIKKSARKNYRDT